MRVLVRGRRRKVLLEHVRGRLDVQEGLAERVPVLFLLILCQRVREPMRVWVVGVAWAIVRIFTIDLLPFVTFFMVTVL